MIYAMSDIHGQYELFRNLMEQIPLGKDDILYVLGDVVDRGPDSMNTLKYMMANPNIIPIMGNHELMALPCLKLLVPELSKEFLHKLSFSYLIIFVYFFKEATICASMAGNSGLIYHNQQSVIIAVSGEQSQ